MAATTTPPRRPRTRIRFELDSLEMSDGHVVVSGRWRGVRGLRFVRPTLIVDGDEVLATLEQKPWPADADPWIAEFPWEDGRIDPRRAALSVAPSVTVPLAWPAGAGSEPAPVPDDLRRRLDEAIAERNALREQIKKLRTERRREMAALRREQQAGRPRLPDPDDDRPIGTRAPTAADLAASSTRGGATAHHLTSPADRAASRLFGAGAFICAFLLVVNALRLVF